MRQFSRHVTLDKLTARCEQRGLVLDTSKYEQGMDGVSVFMPGPDGKNVRVIYTPFNGRFFGILPDESGFSSDNDKYEGTAWYDAMLNLFYIP